MLTDTAAKNAKPGASPHKLSDADGMYLLVTPSGGKYWRFKYRFAGKEKLLALGVYPTVTLKAARKKRDAAREQLAANVDPGTQRKLEKQTARRAAENTFEAVAREWWETKRGGWSEAHSAAVLGRLEKQLLPTLGGRPIAEIEPPELLSVIRTIEARDALELASKTRIVAGQVFRFAIATGRAKSDPSRDLRGAFRTREPRHYAKLSEGHLPEFLSKLDEYDGSAITRLAMKLLLLTFVRSAELRGARWSEFDLAKREWRIPAERMKTRAEHIVPLSDQALAVLDDVKQHTRPGELLFPNEHKPREPMSENTILYALYRLGYRGRATGHGFRATASTILNEQGFRADVIERQLAHKEQNKVRAAYLRSEYLEERRRMMVHWGRYLETLATGGSVVSIRGKRERLAARA
jgi:integrase